MLSNPRTTSNVHIPHRLLSTIPIHTHRFPPVEMTTSIYPAYPPDLSDEQAQFLLTNLKDWSIAHGLAVRPAPSFVSQSQDPAGVLATSAPVTLFPSPFPRHCYEEGLAIQKAYNELYSAIARDEEWLKTVVEECVPLHFVVSHAAISSSPSFMFSSFQLSSPP